jgi:glycosyltransferase involved in cell wall biosynthesis
MTVLSAMPAPGSASRNPQRLHLVHVPTPGDHYSAGTGSAVMTVIHGLSLAHAAAGGQSTILGSRGTVEGYPPYAAGETREIDLPARLPSRPRKLVDAALGRTILTRPFAGSLYAGISDALGRQFDGSLLLHNAPAAIPMLRKKLPHALVALYAHNQLFNTYSPREIRNVIHYADLVLCVSDFIARDITSRAGMASPKVKVVPNGVDTDMFSPAPPGEGTADGARPAVPTILFLGRILESKGPDLLLKAAAAIAKPERPFKIRIVGSQNFDPAAPLTPYERELRRLADSLKDRIEFHPCVPRRRVPDEYRNCSIFAAPSNWDEPFGLTIAEALSCGVPSIVSDRGGIPEVAGDAALYFSPPDTRQFSQRLVEFLDDPDLRKRYAGKARARALELAWPVQYAKLRTILAS